MSEASETGSEESTLFIPSAEIDESIQPTSDDDYIRQHSTNLFTLFAKYGASTELRIGAITVYRNRVNGKYYISYTGVVEGTKTVFDDELHNHVVDNDTYNGLCYMMEFEDELYTSITSLLYQYPDAVCTFEFTSPEEHIHTTLEEQDTVSEVRSLSEEE